MRVILMALLVGCAGQPTQSRQATNLSAVADAARVAEFRRMQSQAAADPVALLAELGVPVSKYEVVARELFMRWASEYPEEHARLFARRPATPTPAPAPPPIPTPPTEPTQPSLGIAESLPWWCVTSANADQCETTKSLCEGRREILGQFAKCDAERNQIAKTACRDVQARLADLSTCERQPNAACFERTRVLGEIHEFACSSSMTSCNERRALALKALKDDFRVTSNCVAR